jgi:hypothetical protein
MRTIRLAIACAALSVFAPATGVTQEASKPTELQRLGFYVGRWSETGEMRDDPNKPFQAIQGGEECRWAAGGQAVVCEEKTTGPGGGWEGIYILSYDPAAGLYHVHGTEKPGGDMHAVGRIDDVRWIWMTDPAADGSRLRYTFAPSGPDARSLVVEAGAGERWARIANIKYTSRK